jgi:hypothetical protein
VTKVCVEHRPHLSRRAPWSIAGARFFVAEVTNGEPLTEGPVFETDNGTRYVFNATRTLEEAENVAATAGDPEVLASGHVVASTETLLATVAVAVAARKGDRKPDISTPDAVKRMLLAAKSIAYPNSASGAAAGVSFDQTLKTLGIADQMQPKITRAQGGAGAMALLARGQVDIGLTFLSEITDPGVEVVGPLPREISTPTALVGFVSSHTKVPEAAKALLSYLSSADGAAMYRSFGMQPARLNARRSPDLSCSLEWYNFYTGWRSRSSSTWTNRQRTRRNMESTSLKRRRFGRMPTGWKYRLEASTSRVIK